MKTIQLTAPKKNTKDCFMDFAYRDSDFDALLPKKQPEQSGAVSVIIRDKDQTFLEMAQEYLGTQDPHKIKQYCLTLPMVEKLIEEHSDELRTDGYANFFFVETGNDKDPVSVAIVSRVTSGWYAGARRLGRGRRWFADFRLLVANLDTSTLGNSDPVLGDFTALEKRVADLEAWRDGITKALNRPMP